MSEEIANQLLSDADRIAVGLGPVYCSHEQNYRRAAETILSIQWESERLREECRWLLENCIWSTADEDKIDSIEALLSTEGGD